MDDEQNPGSDEAATNSASGGSVPDREPLDRTALVAPEFLGTTGVSRLEVVDTTGSTNEDLLRAVRVDPKAWPDLSVLTAEHQSSGRGRLARHWEAPPRSSIAVSMVLRPVNAQGLPLPTHSYSWLSMVAALALREALMETAGLPAQIKWPNDVLVNGRKISGILAQMEPLSGPGVPAVILGTGINVSLTETELPVPTATSVLVEKSSAPDRTGLLKSYLARFATLYRGFCNADGDPEAGLAGGPSLHKRLEHVMVTLGREVRAQLPGDHEIIGHATRLDPYGSLLVVDDAGKEHVVTAGDVVHLRPWSRETGGESGYA